MDLTSKFVLLLLNILAITRVCVTTENLEQTDSCASLYSEENYGGQLINVLDGASVQLTQDSVTNLTLSLTIQNGCELTACYDNGTQLECVATQENATVIAPEYRNIFSANCTCPEENPESSVGGDATDLLELVLANLVVIETNQANFRAEQRLWRDQQTKELQDLKKLMETNNVQIRKPATALRLRPDRNI